MFSPTHIICLVIEVCSVLACIDLRENLGHQLSVGRLAVTVPVVHSQTATSARPPSDGSPCPRATPPPRARVYRGQARGLSACPEQLGELQGKSPSIPPRSEVPGEEERRWRWMMGVERMVGEGRVGEKGLLLGSIGVGVRGACAVDTQAASHQRSPTKPIAPPAQAVGARPAEQTGSQVRVSSVFLILKVSIQRKLTH